MAAKQENKQHNKSGRGFGKPFEKGKSGNPTGRPKGALSLTTVLRHQITSGDAQTIVKNLLEIATKKPIRRKIYGCGCRLHNKDGGRYETYDAAEIKLYEFAVNTIMDRVDGKPSQKVTGDDDKPIRFVIRTELPGFVNGKHKRSSDG